MSDPEYQAKRAARCVELSCDRVGKFAVFGGQFICPPEHAGEPVDLEAEAAAMSDDEGWWRAAGGYRRHRVRWMRGKVPASWCGRDLVEELAPEHVSAFEACTLCVRYRTRVRS